MSIQSKLYNSTKEFIKIKYNNKNVEVKEEDKKEIEELKQKIISYKMPKNWENKLLKRLEIK